MLTLLGKHSRQRDLKSRQQWCDQHVAGLARELDRATEAPLVTAVDADDIGLRVDDPVFNDGSAVVQLPLDRLVAFSRAWRPNLNHDVGRARDVLTREQFRGPFIRYDQQIGFDDVESREQDV